MEVHAALILWKYSIKITTIRYTSLLLDGDSKKFRFLNDERVDGHVPIMKEYINHVSKKLGTGIRIKIRVQNEIYNTWQGKKREFD